MSRPERGKRSHLAWNWCTILTLVFGLAILDAANAGEKEPLYKGMSLLDWIAAFKRADNPPSYVEVRKAIETLGPKADKAIPKLLEFLADDDAVIRDLARQCLVQIGPRAAAPVLRGLENDNPIVRAEIANVLAEIRAAADTTEPALRKLLKDNDRNVRHRAAVALVQLYREDMDVVALLLADLDDDKLRWSAASSLGSCGPVAKAAVPTLIEMLKDEGDIHRHIAAAALGDIGPSAAKAVPALIDLLNDKSPLVQSTVVRTLGYIGPAGAKQAVPALASLTRDKRQRARVALADCLGEIGVSSKEVISILIELLADEDPDVRLKATQSLGQHGPRAKAGTTALLAACADEYAEIRSSALISLMEIQAQGRTVAEVIRKSLADKTLEVRADAALALGKQMPPETENIAALIKALDDPEGAVRLSAALSLRRLGPDAKESLPALMKLLDSPEPFLRIQVAGAIWRAAGMKDTTLPIILRGLQDKKTRGPAARVLGDMGPEARETAGELAKFLDDSDDRDRVKLAVAILRVGGPKEAAIEVLLEALKNPEQRSFALIVMGNLGPEAAELIPAVQSLTQDRRPWVRGSAHEVLRKIDPKGSIER